MVLGPVEGFDFAELHNIAAYFLIKTDDDFKEQITSTFKSLFEVN
jgi:thiamine biosynthesis lipoprotein ApbE